MRAEIDPRDIFHAHKRAVWIRSNDNLAEFLRCLQSSLRADRVRKFLSARDRFTPDLSGGIHVVLLLHRTNDVGHGDTELRELVGFYPKPHRVLTRAKHLHVRNSRNARELIDQIDVAVVGEENSVVGSFWRIKIDEHQRRSCRFLHGHAVVVHVLRQLRLRLRHAQLREDLIDIRIRGDIEIDDHSHVAGVGVDRIHVIHVVHATHLLLDRRGDGLLDSQRVRAGVMRADLNFRRRDLRILRDRQG